MPHFELTPEEKALIRARMEPRPCKGCGKLLTMRPNQDYCNPACRTKYIPARRTNKPPVRLNDLSRAEIEALMPVTEHKCLWCDKHFKGKTKQSFCSLTCKNTYSNAAAALQLERLQIERSAWLRERAELIHEISQLRAELILLRKRAGEGI